MIVKNKLKQICLDKNLALADLAESYGMSPKAFYVKMSRNALKIADVEKMADILGCDLVFMDRKTKKFY